MKTNQVWIVLNLKHYWKIIKRKLPLKNEDFTEDKSILNITKFEASLKNYYNETYIKKKYFTEDKSSLNCAKFEASFKNYYN